MGERTSVGGVLGRARSFVSGRPASQKVGAAGAAALLATAPFGGLSSTPEPPPEQLILGQPTMVGPFLLDIDQVVELPDLAPAVTPEPDERLVIIDADVTLTGDRPEFAVTLTQNLDVTGGGVTLTKPPNLYVVEDSTRMSVFNPGVTYRLAITFVASGPWQGDTATVKANLVEYREEDRQTLNPDAWVGRDEIAWQGTLPVVRRP
jgi:hypothetical protein